MSNANPNDDGLIAAITRVHMLTVVERNVGDFNSFAVLLLNPFNPV